MKRRWTLIVLVVLLLGGAVVFLLRGKAVPTFHGAPGNIVELSFELDKKFEFGEYFFDLANGGDGDFPLCFCLTEKNTYPPDCSGDVKYIYNSTPGTMCVPLNIGTGRCGVPSISSMGHATIFHIPLEYQWTKPVDKIVMGIRVPDAPQKARIVVEVTILKRNNIGKLETYRKYQQAIIVDRQTTGTRSE